MVDRYIIRRLASNSSWPFPYKVDPIMKSQVEKIDYKSIYELACAKGNEAAQNCPPAPVVDNLGNHTSQGACGFGIIWFPDERSGTVKWLRNNNIGSRSYRGGWEIWFNPVPKNDSWWGVQSIEPKYAYARAFVEAYKTHGIECYEACRMD